MTGTFSNALKFNQPLDWDVSAVEDFSTMFRNAIEFDQDLSSWDVSRARDLSSMFENASAFNQDISMWNVERVTSAESIFDSASRFNQNLCALGLKNHFARYDFAFLDSGCPQQGLPNRSLVPPGPFCTECGSSDAISASSWEIIGLGMWFTDGDCVVESNCITSHEQVGQEPYGDRHCMFAVASAGTLVVESFDVEDKFNPYQRNDGLFLQADGHLDEFTGSNMTGLDNRTVDVGTRLSFFGENYFGEALGWKICLV